MILTEWKEADIDALILMDSEEPRPKMAEMAQRLGMTESAVKAKRFTLRKAGRLDGKMPPKELDTDDGSIEVSGSTAKIVKNKLRQQVKTLEDLIRVCEIDTDTWEITGWLCKAYGGYIKNAKKRPEMVQLYSVAATLKSKTGVNHRLEIEALIDEAKAHAPKFPALVQTAQVRLPTGYMLELSVPDLHIGKLAWGPECGQPYDSKIAAELYEDAVDDILAKCSPYQFDEINLVIGNDMINVDNSSNMTTKGTPQSCDSRSKKMFSTAYKLVRDAVELKLRGRAAKINIIVVPGNHDTETAWFLGEVLSAWFHNCPDVHVDNRPTLRKYIQFGKCMIGFTHGNEEKQADLPLNLAMEQPQMWADTHFREIHVGHLHQRSAVRFKDVGEYKGTIVRILPSLCAPEDWHVAKGYIGNIRSAEGYIWHKDTGLCGTVIYNVPMSEAA